MSFARLIRSIIKGRVNEDNSRAQKELIFEEGD